MAAEGGFLVSWDTHPKKNGKAGGAKMYGHYRDITRKEYMERLMEIPLAKRNCYESILPGQLSRAHIDVEWEGFWISEKDQHEEIVRIVDAIKMRLERLFGIKNAAVIALCGSRSTGKEFEGQMLYKYSYHIILPKLFFEDNQDIKKFVDFQDQNIQPWIHTDKQGKTTEKSPIDLGIYTLRRQFRMPLCCKAGTSVPLRRINLDPLLVSSFHHFSDDDVDAVLPALIQGAVPGEGDYIVPKGWTPERDEGGSDQPVAAARANKERKPARDRPSADKTARIEVPDGQLPFSLDSVREVLRANGDNVSAIVEHSIQKDLDTHTYSMRCNQSGNPRKCLHPDGHIHDSNNCALEVSLGKNRQWRVHYRCFAEKCRCLQHRRIGTFAATSIPANPTQSPTPDHHQKDSDDPFDQEPDEVYCEQNVRPFPMDREVLAIRSPCGTGKSETLVTHIQKLADKALDEELLRRHPDALTDPKVRDNIMQSLYRTQNRQIVKQYVRCITTIACTDYPGMWPNILPQIGQLIVQG